MKKIMWLFSVFFSVLILLFLFLHYQSDSEAGIPSVSYFSSVEDQRSGPAVDLERLYAATGATIKIRPDFLARFQTNPKDPPINLVVLSSSPRFENVGLYCPDKGSPVFSLTMRSDYEREHLREGI